MRIQVRLFAILRRYQPNVGPEGLYLELAEGTTVGQAVQRLAIPDGEHLVAMVNSSVRQLDHKLANGDTLSLFPPVAGG